MALCDSLTWGKQQVVCICCLSGVSSQHPLCSEMSHWRAGGDIKDRWSLADGGDSDVIVQEGSWRCKDDSTLSLIWLLIEHAADENTRGHFKGNAFNVVCPVAWDFSARFHDVKTCQTKQSNYLQSIRMCLSMFWEPAWNDLSHEN